MQEKVNLKVDWCSYEAAKYACLNWHYSKCTPVGKLVKIGAWENGEYIGCVLFGRGANNNIGSPYCIKQNEVCELVRIALKKHETQVSKIMAIAIRFLKKSNSMLKLIVSYADNDQNHHGCIYQATNWIYIGLMNNGSMGAFTVNGKKMHPKSVHSKGVKQTILEVRKHLDPNATVFYTKGKHKYLMPLNKQMRKQILPLSKPYPKKVTCPTSIDSDATDYQSGEGGVSPTVGLHI